MTDAILTLNAGSSSPKFALFGAGSDARLATAPVDRIGPDGTMRLRDAGGVDIAVPPGDLTSHAAALGAALAALGASFPETAIPAVGHRVVHGGPDHAALLLLDEAVLAVLEALFPFAPLHQPHNRAGIRAAMRAFPGIPQIACFDTAFHRGQPLVHDTIALPREYYSRGVRRYGFHMAPFHKSLGGFIS